MKQIESIIFKRNDLDDKVSKANRVKGEGGLNRIYI